MQTQLYSGGSREHPGITIPFSHICVKNFNDDADAVFAPWGLRNTAVSPVSGQVQRYLEILCSTRDTNDNELLADFEDFIKSLGLRFEESPEENHVLALALHIVRTSVVEANLINELGYCRAFPSLHPDQLEIRTRRPVKINAAFPSWLLAALWSGRQLMALKGFMERSYVSCEAGIDYTGVLEDIV